MRIDPWAAQPLRSGTWVAILGAPAESEAGARRELYDVPEGALVVRDVQTDPTFAPGEMRELFSTQGYENSNPHARYDVTADDQRFVMIRHRSTGGGKLILVENFFEELKAKVGN